MASDPLSLRSLKYRRAQRHLREMHRIAAVYNASSPYVPADQADLQALGPGALAGLHILRTPPASISVSLGDALQDLKSALDHAVYELARLHDATPDQLEDSEFLIAEGSGWYRRNRQKRLGRVGPDALAFIDGLQPYLGLDAEHPLRACLRTIHQLARIDRHRHIHVAQLAMGAPTMFLGPAPEDVTVPDGKVYVNLAFPMRVGVYEAELMGFLPLSPILEEVERGSGEILVRLSDFRS